MVNPVSIIIPAHNQLDYCKQCIASIVANTDLPYHLILVDNGSTDGVAALFDSIPDATVVHVPENRGFSGGINLGLAHASGDVVILNSDTWTPRGWLERLHAALHSDNDVGIAGPRSNYAPGPQQIDGLQLQDITDVQAYSDGLAAEFADRRTEVQRLSGFCWLMREAAWREAGLFDESFGIGNYEDDDYCKRVIAAGYKLVIAEDAFVFHYGHRTFLGMGVTDERWRGLMAENRFRFTRKWDAHTLENKDALLASKSLNEQARTMFEQGEAAPALKLLMEAIETFPDLEMNYNDLGVVLWSLEDGRRAYDAFARGLQLNPFYTECRDNFFECAGRLGRLNEAREMLNGLQDQWKT